MAFDDKNRIIFLILFDVLNLIKFGLSSMRCGQHNLPKVFDFYRKKVIFMYYEETTKKSLPARVKRYKIQI